MYTYSLLSAENLEDLEEKINEEADRKYVLQTFLIDHDTDSYIAIMARYEPPLSGLDIGNEEME